MKTNTPRRTALYVDDNADDREIFRLFAAKMDPPLHLLCYESLSDAKTWLLDSSRAATNPLPSFVLVDYNLDAECGGDFIAWIRSNPMLDGLLVILFTDGDNASRFEHCYAAGADYCLEKPITVERITALVHCLAGVADHTSPLTVLEGVPEYRSPAWRMQPG